MLSLAVTLSLVACGGEEKAAETPQAPVEASKPVEAAPKVEAPAPAAAPADPPSGPYTPDDLAKAAYDAAKAAGADGKENPHKGMPEAIAAGKSLYDTRCTTCHGALGIGEGIAGQALPQKPAQFAWKERWEATSVGTKHWVVLNGITGTAMAPLGLSEDEAWQVLAYAESEFHK